MDQAHCPLSIVRGWIQSHAVTTLFYFSEGLLHMISMIIWFVSLSYDLSLNLAQNYKIGNIKQRTHIVIPVVIVMCVKSKNSSSNKYKTCRIRTCPTGWSWRGLSKTTHCFISNHTATQKRYTLFCVILQWWGKKCCLQSISAAFS